MLCSELRCQKGFDLKNLCSHKTRGSSARGGAHSREACAEEQEVARGSSQTPKPNRESCIFEGVQLSGTPDNPRPGASTD